MKYIHTYHRCCALYNTKVASGLTQKYGKNDIQQKLDVRLNSQAVTHV